MIETTTLLKQMALLIQKAQQNPTDANVREQLTAIRALCDVMLQSQQGGLETSGQGTFIQHTEMPQSRTMPKRADIEQQNDSIFDF